MMRTTQEVRRNEDAHEDTLSPRDRNMQRLSMLRSGRAGAERGYGGGSADAGNVRL